MIEVDETNWSPIFQPKPIRELTSEELMALQKEFCDHLKPLGVVTIDHWWYDGENEDMEVDPCDPSRAIVLRAPVAFERVINRRGSLNLLQCAAAGRRWFAWIENESIEWVNPLPPPKPIETPSEELEPAHAST